MTGLEDLPEDPPVVAVPPMEVVCELPGGYTMWRQENGAGGHSYFTNQIGDGVLVWDTCLTDRTTLLIALAEEGRRADAEARERLAQARLLGCVPDGLGGMRPRRSPGDAGDIVF